MYKVYADGHLLYSDTIENLKIVSPKVDLEVNKTGKFTFTIWPNHPYYGLIYKLKSIITIYQDDYLMFRGRVLDDEFGFHNERKIICEGHLAFLLDSFIRPYNYSGSIEGFLAMLLDSHNSQVDVDKQFVLGKVTVTDPNGYITRSDVNGGKTLDIINNKLIKLLGGYIHIRHEDGVFYLDYLKDFTVLAPQKIEFAKNLLDMKITRKGSNIATVLVPYGAKIKDSEGNDTDVRLTIEDVNDGLDYIYDEEAVKKYGWIVATYTWDDVTVASNLLSKAKEHLASLVENPDTLELSAADLATAGEKVESFHLGTYVQVTSNPHGIDQKFLVSKLSIQLLNPIANKLTLGGVIESFTTQSMKKLNSVTVAKGEKGAAGTSSYMYIRYSANADGSNMTEEPQADTEYIGVATTTISTAPTEASAYTWSKIKGEQGEAGAAGKDGQDGVAGKGISKITEYYLASPLSSGVTTDTAGWNTEIPTITPTNKYLWNYEVITYTDNSKLTIAPVIIGVYGEKGDTGATGNGISGITEHYLATSSASGVTTDTSGWTTAIQTITSSNKYLWNYEVITYTNGTNKTTTPVIIGVYGDKGDTGATGATGAAGKDAAIQSATAPSDTSYMWLDISSKPPILKRYNGTEWEVVNDNTEAMQILEENLQSSIQESSTNLLLTVSENYYLKDDTDALVQSVSTELEQTKDSFNMIFTQYSADLDALAAGTDAEFEEIKKYIRFSDGKILLGEVGNELELQIANDRISFLQNNVEVAYFTNRKLYVTDGEYTNSLTLGQFAFIPRTNGNLSFKKMN